MYSKRASDFLNGVFALPHFSHFFSQNFVRVLAFQKKFYFYRENACETKCFDIFRTAPNNREVGKDRLF